MLSCLPGRLWGGTVNSSDAPVCDEARGCVFVVGQPLPDSSSITALSNTVIVNVEWRAIRLPADAQHDHVCLDWEPWVHSLPCSCKSPLAPQCSSHCLQFTRHNAGGWMHRPGAAGIPILGMYSSFNPAVIRQHAFWMVEAGVNCILVDWSNNLWSGLPAHRVRFVLPRFINIALLRPVLGCSEPRRARAHQRHCPRPAHPQPSSR